MREVFAEIVLEWGIKHWSFGVRRNLELMAWIAAETSDLSDATPFAERAYSAVHGERATCPNGKQRKLKNIKDGWGFCARTGKCVCAQQQIAKKISNNKRSLTDSERADIQAKREATNIIRYGHVNTGQTEKARIAHQEFYADLDNVRNQLRKQVATMMERYDVQNAAHLRGAVQRRKATLATRYGVTNPMQDKTIAAKSIATRLEQGYSKDYYQGKYNRFAERVLLDWRLHLLTPISEYDGWAKTRRALQFRCINCDRTLVWRLSHRMPRCPICNPSDRSYKSQEEMELFDFIKTKLAITDLISGDRSLIAPYELDISSESNRIAIEYCGSIGIVNCSDQNTTTILQSCAWPKHPACDC